MCDENTKLNQLHIYYMHVVEPVMVVVDQASIVVEPFPSQREVRQQTHTQTHTHESERVSMPPLPRQFGTMPPLPLYGSLRHRFLVKPKQNEPVSCRLCVPRIESFTLRHPN